MTRRHWPGTLPTGRRWYWVAGVQYAVGLPGMFTIANGVGCEGIYGVCRKVTAA